MNLTEKEYARLIKSRSLSPEQIEVMDFDGDEKKRSKYNNQPVQYFGIWFDSQHEGARYLQLREMQERGEITNLKTQRTFSMEHNGVKICDYIADFTYTDLATGHYVVEDTKGYLTKEYRLKRKMMLAFHQITIKEVYAKPKVKKTRKKKVKHETSQD